MFRLILAGLLWAWSAAAQVTGLPPDTQAAIRAIGPNMAPLLALTRC